MSTNATASTSSNTSIQPNISQTYLAGATRRLHDIRTFQLDRLRSCRTLGMWTELVGEMKADLERARANLEMARELAESQLKPSEREQVLSKIDMADAELAELRIAYRETLLSSKTAITSMSKSKRHELNSSSSFDKTTTRSSGLNEGTEGAGASRSEYDEAARGRQRDPKRSDMGDDALQTKTNEVTDALRRTTMLMQAELERSVLAVQTLDSSTQTLRLTQTLYDNYTSLLTTSSQLVKAIEKADWYDRLLILGAFLFFLMVVGWVIKRRVLDKVVGGVGWWVGGSLKLVKMGTGLGGRASASQVKNVGQAKFEKVKSAVSAASSLRSTTLLSDAASSVSKVSEFIATPIASVTAMGEQAMARDEL
ncbi:Sec20-domain-containing protein [Kockovaella imperatae]|uniref:Sec20-domain-containing protein n=1 Tax=Kockovaella imperatae TaxID=4999 RepID=A0A1Y1UKI9_9TREE|nr:Sec20-domain-containing protein [Kockovaella imperatae]ORX38568.1 Sec20-domain-containing protein [Kockovaella imperatae]